VPLKYMKIKELFRRNIWLITIIFIASILRLWQLGSIPPHLTADEASLGYNAYSILKTGKDEYGEVLPLIFKSFGDYKPGLYIYSTVPFVAALGLNELSVRLTASLAGIFVVYLAYLISKRLFEKKKIALCIAAVAAINPWLIYFSRGAWEANLSLALTLAGILFFLKSFEKSRYLTISSIFFALTLLTYQGAKLSTGIVVFLLVAVHLKKVVALPKKTLIISFLAALLISVPILLSLFGEKTGRLTVFSIFSYPRKAETLNSLLQQGQEKVGDVSYYFFHSESLNFGRAILGRWFNHFSGRFLFFEGDWQNPRHSAPNQGMLLLSDLILVILGFASLVKVGWRNKTSFVWLWLILAPLPAILSRDEVHAVRALNLAVPLVIVLGMGLERVLAAGKLAKFVFAVAFMASTIYFLDAYFVHLPKHNSIYWSYGYKQIVETVSPIQGNYKAVKVQQSYAQPYIYFLFYQKYDPAKYQAQARLVKSQFEGDVGLVEKLDNICFCAMDWPSQRGEEGTLFAADTIAIPPSDSSDEGKFALIKEIKYLNGLDTAFRIIEVK